MSNLSDLLPAGASAKQLTFTDSGSGIATKKPVILNSDGTVAEVSSSTATANVGSITTFNSDAATWCATAAGSGSTNLVAYADSGASSYGTAQVGTISGTNVTFGTKAVFESAAVTGIKMAYSSSLDKYLIVYRDDGNSYYGTAVVATVSGTSVTFGTPVAFSARATYGYDVVYDDTAGAFVVQYGDNNDIFAKACTVSGTVPTFGGELTSKSTGTSGDSSVAYDSTAGKVVGVWRTYTSPPQGGEAMVYSLSGTTLTANTIVVYASGNILTGADCKISYNVKENRIVIGYKEGAGTSGTAIAGEVSGTSITFGTAVQFNASSSGSITCDYDATVARTIIGYLDAGAAEYPKAIPVTLSGSTITFPDSATTLQSAAAANLSASYNATEGKMLFSWLDTSPVQGDSAVFTSPGTVENLSAQAFVGVADSAISASAAGSIIVQGGTVTGVSSGTGVSAGTAVQYSASNLADLYAADSVYDSTNNKTVVVYDGAGAGAGYGIVATISGTSVSYGSAVQYSGGNAQHSQVTYDSTNQRVVVAYVDSANSGYLTVAVGTVSGTSISWGTPVVADSTVNDFYIGIDFDINAGKVLIIWKDNSTAYNYSIVGTVSGTSISFGTRVLVDGSWGYQQIGGLTYDVNAQKHLFTRNRTGIGADAYVGTISGTSVSWGSATSISSTEYLYIFQGAYDSNAQKIAIVYRDASASDFSSQVATISGTSVSFGTRAVIDSTISPDFAGSYYDSSDQTIVAFGRATNYYGYVGTVSGTSISWSSASTLLLDAAFGYGLGTPAYDANADAGLILFANAGDSAAESAVTTAGALPLTTGTKYYVTTSGGFSSSADTPSVNAGLAISTTSLLLNGDS